MNLSNCPQCGKVYVKNSYNMCPNCLREIEDQYRKCVDHLRKNRSCTLHELSEETGVPVRMIIRFIREGRIAAKDAPNVLTPCESCGEPIKEGTLCANCRSQLAKDFSHAQEDAKRREERQNALEFGSTYMKDRDKFDKR
ncbi:flagellar protein [Paenibacillus mesophilus]|uniref:TIGR03826 family flagellar region protein n=1 Tax=Paenibacillus mesophilus TaxID=2582849 RepID=UPI00110D47E9|nr:TIGR03826 family flagellar region protein [Paenibacillus mesophilus]TMV47168.1 flagellar protein [Paenibacillus mesophilus]